MIVNIIILFESGRRLQMITTTLQKKCKGVVIYGKSWLFANLLFQTVFCEGAVKFGWSLSLQICCPKPPSLRGALQFGWSLSPGNFLSQTALFARRPPIWIIIIIYKFLVPNSPRCQEPSNLDDHYLCKFVVPNRPLCKELSNLDDHYYLQICCPKSPSLQGGLQFGWSLLFTNFLKWLKVYGEHLLFFQF